MWLLSVSLSFVAGVALATTGHDSPSVMVAVAAGTWLLLSREKPPRGAIVLTLCLVSMLLGAWRYEHSIAPTSGPALSFYNSEARVSLSGRVDDHPEVDGPYVRVVLDDVAMWSGDSAASVEGRVRVTLRHETAIHYGDTLSLAGTLEAPRNFSDFDYVAYLEQQGIRSTMFLPTVLDVQSPLHRTPLVAVHSLSDALKGSLDRALPQPQCSLGQTLLLGRRDSLSDGVRDSFARAGAAHMLAVSGLHLAIVTAAILALALAVLGRWHYFYVWIAIAGVVFYVLLTGMRPPVVRAGIMAGLFLFAELAGRQKHGPTALGFAAAVMVFVEPILLTQLSFQLSFMAMAGLVVLYQPIRGRLDALLERMNPDSDRHVRLLAPCMDIIAATVAATAMTLPVIARAFGQVPMVGLPVSLLALPVLPFAIAGAAGVASLGLLSTTAAAVAGWFAWLPLTFILSVVELASRLPGASLAVGSPPVVAELMYYALLLLPGVLWHQRPRLRDERRHAKPEDVTSTPRLWYAVPPLLLAVVLVWSAVLDAPDGQLHVTFFDVGQGDACLVQTPEGHTVVIDGGLDGAVMSHHLGSSLPFWDRSVDLVVNTHQHEDHLCGLMPLASQGRTGFALYPSFEPETELHAQWMRALSGNGIEAVAAERGGLFDFGDGTLLEVLGPEGSSDCSDCDDNSVVLRLSYGNVVFLFTGDIAEEAERRLCHSAENLDCTVLKVAHHGSDTSSCAQFVAAASPDIAIVSVGADNSYGHPSPDVLKRLATSGATVFTTAENGTIEFITNGRTITVHTDA